MEKEKIIDAFLEKLRKQNPNDLDWKTEGSVGDILKNFAIACKKCGSTNIFVS